MGLSIVMNAKPAPRDHAPAREAAEVKAPKKPRKRVSPSQQLAQPDKPEEQGVRLGLMDVMASPKREQDKPVAAAPDDGPPIVPASQPKDVEALVIVVKKDQLKADAEQMQEQVAKAESPSG